MKCDRIKDIIITDYLDGRLSGKELEGVEEHLAGCKECREYLEALKENAAEPFSGVEPMEVPAEVWEGVRRKMNREPGESIRGVFDLLGLLAVPRRAALAAVSAVLAVFLLSGVHVWRIYDRGLTSRYMEMQMDYFSEDDPQNGNGAQFGSVIEEFLM